MEEVERKRGESQYVRAFTTFQVKSAPGGLSSVACLGKGLISLSARAIN